MVDLFERGFMDAVRIARQADRICDLEEELRELRVARDTWKSRAESMLKLVEHYRNEPEPKPRSRRPVPPLTRLMVLARDDWRCRQCGATEQLHIDHINPVANGGGNEYDNLQALCRACNSSKGARPPGGWPKPDYSHIDLSQAPPGHEQDLEPWRYGPTGRGAGKPRRGGNDRSSRQ